LWDNAFVTQAAIEAEYRAARTTGGYFDTAAFLNQMIGVTSAPGDRVLFLDALAASNINSYSESTRARPLSWSRLSEWESTPSVQQWALKVATIRYRAMLFPALRGGIMDETILLA